MTTVPEALRSAAAGNPVTDLPDLLTAAAWQIDRLAVDLSRALGVPEGAVRVRYGLGEALAVPVAPGGVSGAEGAL